MDDFRIYPDRLVLQSGFPAMVHNISLVAEHQVSFKPFYAPEEFNVRPGEITPITFTLDRTRDFTVRHELHGLAGDLIVRDSFSDERR